MAASITVLVADLPLFKELHSAAHALLVARLLGELHIAHWNRLIDAHDAICDSARRDGAA